MFIWFYKKPPVGVGHGFTQTSIPPPIFKPEPRDKLHLKEEEQEHLKDL